jgi:hypothetical protein
MTKSKVDSYCPIDPDLQSLSPSATSNSATVTQHFEQDDAKCAL